MVFFSPLKRKPKLDAAEAANLALARHIVRLDEELAECRQRIAVLEAVVNAHTIEFGRRAKEPA